MKVSSLVGTLMLAQMQDPKGAIYDREVEVRVRVRGTISHPGVVTDVTVESDGKVVIWV